MKTSAVNSKDLRFAFCLIAIYLEKSNGLLLFPDESPEGANISELSCYVGGIVYPSSVLPHLTGRNQNRIKLRFPDKFRS